MSPGENVNDITTFEYYFLVSDKLRCMYNNSAIHLLSVSQVEQKKNDI